MFIAAIVSLVVLVPLTSDAKASAKPSATSTSSQSCRQVVESFYDWYLLKANIRGWGSEEAVRRNKADFSPSLFRALNANAMAQDRSRRIVGPDFDPFFNAQTTFARYALGEPHFKNRNCFITIKFTSPGIVMTSAAEPELALQSGRWVFVNFHYGKSRWSDDENLLSILHNSGF